MNALQLFLPCAAGVEDFLAAEVHGLTGLQGEDLLTRRGGVMVRASWRDAMLLNLQLAAIMGVLIPLVMQKMGRDPAVGASVMITAITDSGGFFIFLGLATIFLL